jgi:hypothetical protein
MPKTFSRTHPARLLLLLGKQDLTRTNKRNSAKSRWVKTGLNKREKNGFGRKPAPEACGPYPRNIYFWLKPTGATHFVGRGPESALAGPETTPGQDAKNRQIRFQAAENQRLA